MQATGKVYTGIVIQDENGELMLQFSPEMINELGWREGDTIVWDIDENGGPILARKIKPEEL